MKKMQNVSFVNFLVEISLLDHHLLCSVNMDEFDMVEIDLPREGSAGADDCVC